MIHYEIITKKDRIFEYQGIWHQLFDSGEHEASTSFEWTHALLQTHLKENDVFLLMVLKDSQEVVGLVPLIVSQTKKYGLSILNLFPISEYYNTHSDLLLKDQSDELIEAFMSGLFSLPYRWDVFRVGHLVETNPILEHIERYLKETSKKYDFEREEPSFFLTLDESFDDYLRKRSGKFRNYLKRMTKKIERMGHVTFLKLRDYDGVSDAYTHLMLIEERSWKHDRRTAISSVKKQANFYKTLCDAANERGRLHLLFLCLNNEPIAYNMGLIKDKKYFYLKTSFVEDLRQVSPSTILRAKLVEDLILGGTRYFDFPGEPYAWERQWTEELRWHKSLLIYNDTAKAKLLSAYNDLRHSMTNRDDDNQVKYHNPLDIKPDSS